MSPRIDLDVESFGEKVDPILLTELTHTPHLHSV